jgi:hypothetical protein
MDEEHKDQTHDEQDRVVLARRVLRLEERLDQLESGRARGGAEVHPAWPLALGCTAVVFGYLGTGLPMHPYQYLFAGLLLFLACGSVSLYLQSRAFSCPIRTGAEHQ